MLRTALEELSDQTGFQTGRTHWSVASLLCPLASWLAVWFVVLGGCSLSYKSNQKNFTFHIFSTNGNSSCFFVVLSFSEYVATALCTYAERFSALEMYCYYY